MPTRTLRFCPTCLATQHVGTREACSACGTKLRPLLDEQGALSRDFLTCRKTCCDSGCRNCPYPHDESAAEQTKSCERCGVSFGCQPANCWCENELLSPATLKWLRRSYADCLCPQCLREFASA